MRMRAAAVVIDLSSPPLLITVIPNSDLGGGGICCPLGRPERKQIPRAKIRRFGMTVSRGEVIRAEAVARQRQS